MSTKKMNRGDAEVKRLKRLAKRIARYLFTDWLGRRNVRRLVVEKTDKTTDRSGYCEEAIADTIERFLLRASASQRLKRKVKA
jgi:hypothetical protein